MKLFSIAILTLFSLTNCFASSGCNTTIRGLLLNNELAVQGKISSIEPGERYSKMFIEVEELLLGSDASRGKEIMFSSSEIENVRAIYHQNTTCIIFARSLKIENNSVYYSSPCFKINGSNEKIKTYSKAIKELVAINRLENPKNVNQATVDWCIKNLFIEELNWQSIAELSNQGFLYDNNTDKPKRNNIKLSKNNINSIKHYLISKDVLEYNDPWLIDLAFKRSDNVILEKLVKQLKRTDLNKDIWYTELSLISKISELKRDDDLICIAKEINEIGVLTKSIKVKELVAQFIQLIK